MLSSLLNTKLYLPAVRPNLAARPRLLERLDEGLRLGRRLSLISAPAGYGKSMLAVEWLHHLRSAPDAHRLSWLSLDENDNDPFRFMLYLAAALQKLDESIGADIQGMLASSLAPSVETLMTGLINDLWQAAPGGMVLALDDYHKVRLGFIHDAVQFLLDHAPERFHLVLITREDPPLQLARMRVRGELTELRTRELRFSAAEAGEFIHRATGESLPPEWIAALAERTEGWIAGLQLAALSLQGRTDARQFIEDFRGSHRYVIDYLMEEVLRLQNDEVRSFLYQTSILERFNAALCDAVAERSDSRAMIESIEQANLFLIPLDDRREWYRYHHLFSDFLRVTLSEAQETALHTRAAEWFEAGGFRGEAVEHALLAKDYPAAARKILAAANEMIGGGRLTALLRWIEALPQDSLNQFGDLLGHQAWCLYFTGRFEDAARLLAAAGERLERLSPLAQGRVLSLQAWVANAREDERTAALAEQALELIGDADAMLRATTLLPLGHGLRRRNDWPAAAAAYRQAMEAGYRSGAALAIVSPANSLAVTLVEQGRRLQAQALCRETRERVRDGRGKPLPVADLLCISEALIHYEANALAEARDLALKAIETSERFLTGRVMGGDAERVLVRAYAGLGDPQAALEVIAETRRVGGHLKWILPMIDALEAELFLSLGQVGAAAEWARRAELSPEAAPLPARELLYTTYARLLIRQGQAQAALTLLQRLEERVRSGGREARRMTLLILQALAHEALGARPQAFARLTDALRLAAPDGYLRRFLKEGAPLSALLHAYRAAGSPAAAPGEQAFLDAVFQAFSPQSPDRPAAANEAGQPPADAVLSEQEIRILRLMAAGLSNQEIAGELFISVGTAKWHAHHIYQKLGVSSRTQAISRARETGALD